MVVRVGRAETSAIGSLQESLYIRQVPAEEQDNPLRYPKNKARPLPHTPGVTPRDSRIGAFGGPGAKAIDLIANELNVTMGLCGVNTIAEIDDHVLAI